MIVCPPPVQNLVQNDIAALVYRADTMKTNFWRQHSNVLPVPSPSAFWARARHFIKLTESARKATAFENGWDGYNAPPPNDESVDRTLEVLSEVQVSKLTPYSVLPSADGGVGISFRGNADKRAILELLNDGTSLYMLYGKGYPLESSVFDTNTELSKVLQLLEEYL
jgi:hypothetical protein